MTLSGRLSSGEWRIGMALSRDQGAAARVGLRWGKRVHSTAHDRPVRLSLCVLRTMSSFLESTKLGTTVIINLSGDIRHTSGDVQDIDLLS